VAASCPTVCSKSQPHQRARHEALPAEQFRAFQFARIQHQAPVAARNQPYSGDSRGDAAVPQRPPLPRGGSGQRGKDRQAKHSAIPEISTAAAASSSPAAIAGTPQGGRAERSSMVAENPLNDPRLLRGTRHRAASQQILQLGIAELQQRFETRPFGSAGMRVAAAQIALQQKIQLAAAAAAAPSQS